MITKLSQSEYDKYDRPGGWLLGISVLVGLCLIYNFITVHMNLIIVIRCLLFLLLVFQRKSIAYQFLFMSSFVSLVLLMVNVLIISINSLWIAKGAELIWIMLYLFFTIGLDIIIMLYLYFSKRAKVWFHQAVLVEP